MISVQCRRCNRTFSIFPYQLKKQKEFFCQFSCRKGFALGSRKPPKLCEHCGQNNVEQRAARKVRYCSRKCFGHSVRKKYIIKKGYKRVIQPDHPRADSKGYVREHILIMEKKIGRYIKLKEVVHHIDGNKLNNNVDNLELIANQSEHMKLHRS